jgi:hypothetical protein
LWTRDATRRVKAPGGAWHPIWAGYAAVEGAGDVLVEPGVLEPVVVVVGVLVGRGRGELGRGDGAAEVGFDVVALGAEDRRGDAPDLGELGFGVEPVEQDAELLEREQFRAGEGSGDVEFVFVHGRDRALVFVRASIEGGADRFARAHAPMRRVAKWLSGGGDER